MMLIGFGMTHLVRNTAIALLVDMAVTYLLYIAGKIRTVVRDTLTTLRATVVFLDVLSAVRHEITLFFIERYKSTSTAS